MTSRHLVLGGPGAGKTAYLVNQVERILSSGTPPDKIAFCAFTNAAADEARDRACKRFGLIPKQLPYFRTLHSLAFREMGLNRRDVVTEQHLSELAEITGEMFTGDTDPSSPAAGRNADPLLTLDHYARTTMRGLRAAYEDHGGNVEWFRLLRFSEAYRLYKEDRGLLDFTDMLSEYTVGQTSAAVPVNVAIVDEAQDLTALQWVTVGRAFPDCELWIGGDDDQSIYAWSGADHDRFLTLPYPPTVLPTSHRLPRAVFNLAQTVAARISRRYPKEHHPAREGGEVTWVVDPSEADLSKGTWLLLARTRAQLTPLVQAARDQGVVYSVKGRGSVDPEHVRAIVAHEALRAGKRVEGGECTVVLMAAGVVTNRIDEGRSYTSSELGYDASPIWHDALVRIPLDVREYYLTCLRRGESLTRPSRVRIETIHGAKGLEAENVLLVTDMTYRTHRGYELDPDSEERVLYVGLTRASERLFLQAPQGAYGYVI